MAPSQVSIEPEEKKPDIAGKTLVAEDDKGTKLTSNPDNTAFDMEVSSDQKVPALSGNENVGVDIVDCTDTTDIKMEEADDPNATECSSSFSGTVSGNADGSNLSDAEVESRFNAGNDSNLFDGFDSLFPMRKKKLTAQWRCHIHPLMWRCKWLELKIKELQSQSLKYDRELAFYDQRKELELGEGCDTRSLPIGQNSKKKVMKRRKRNKMEDKVDIPSYMSHHNLFSYYERKRSDAEGASVDDDCGLQVHADTKNNDLDLKDAWPSCESGDDGISVEKVIYDIEATQSRVKKLKIQLDELLTIHAGRFSSMENLSLLLQSDLPSSSARSPTSSRKGDAVPIGALTRHRSESDVRDLLMPEGAVLAAVEPTPDVIGSTRDMLSAAGGHLTPQNEDLCGSVADKVLANDQKTEKGFNDFEKASGIPTENNSQQIVKEEANEMEKEETKEIFHEANEMEKEEAKEMMSVPDCEPDLCQEAPIAQEQSVLKFSLAADFVLATNKRKRDQRKARSGVWKAGKIFKRRSASKAENQ